jgi:hypothetical protein
VATALLKKLIHRTQTQWQMNNDNDNIIFQTCTSLLFNDSTYKNKESYERMVQYATLVRIQWRTCRPHTRYFLIQQTCFISLMPTNREGHVCKWRHFPHTLYIVRLTDYIYCREVRINFSAFFILHKCIKLVNKGEFFQLWNYLINFDEIQC